MWLEVSRHLIDIGLMLHISLRIVLALITLKSFYLMGHVKIHNFFPIGRTHFLNYKFLGTFEVNIRS